jgi:hypothetical protein
VTVYNRFDVETFSFSAAVPMVPYRNLQLGNYKTQVAAPVMNFNGIKWSSSPASYPQGVVSGIIVNPVDVSALQVWDGTALKTPTVGVWDGTKILPATTAGVWSGMGIDPAPIIPSEPYSSGHTAGWGVYNGMGWTGDTSDVDYIKIVGATPKVGISYYSAPDNSGPNQRDLDRIARGTLPQISLETKSYAGDPTWSWKDVAAGVHDSRYLQWAQAFKALDAPVLFCPDHEGDEQINNNQRPAGDTAADYIAAWKHIRALISPIAPKVLWVWWMGGSNTTTMRSCYPGDAFVDAVGCDPYKWPSHPAGETLRQTWNGRLASWDAYVGANVPRAITETACDIAFFGVPAAVAWWSDLAAAAKAYNLRWVNLYNRSSDGSWAINNYPQVISTVQSQIAQMTGPILGPDGKFL